MPEPHLSRHVAIVTGGNHGIGAATATTLAAAGARVLVSYLRIDDPADPGTPEAYRAARRSDATTIVGRILAAGGIAVALEADLADPSSAARLSTLPRRSSAP